MHGLFLSQGGSSRSLLLGSGTRGRQNEKLDQGGPGEIKGSDGEEGDDSEGDLAREDGIPPIFEGFT